MSIYQPTAPERPGVAPGSGNFTESGHAQVKNNFVGAEGRWETGRMIFRSFPGDTGWAHLSILFDSASFLPCRFLTLIVTRTGNVFLLPTVLPTLGCRDPTPGVFIGALQPLVGNTVGIASPVSVHYPINMLVAS